MSRIDEILIRNPLVTTADRISGKETPSQKTTVVHDVERRLFSDLSLKIYYLDGGQMTYYGRELRNSIKQIKYQGLDPVLDYETALIELIKLVQSKIDKVKTAQIYLTSFMQRIRGENGRAIYKWNTNGLVFDAQWNPSDPANEKYLRDRAAMIKKTIQEATIIINGFYRMERVVIR